MGAFSLRKCCCGRSFRHYAFIFLIVFLSALTLHDVIVLIVEYSENPTSADINIVFNDTIQLPNITFCLDADYAKVWIDEPGDEHWGEIVQEEISKMTDRDAFLKSDWNYRVTFEANQVIGTLTTLEREYNPEFFAFRVDEARRTKFFVPTAKWLELIDRLGISFEEWRQKVAFEMLKKMIGKWDRLTKEDDVEKIKAGLKVVWMSARQLCIQPVYTAENLRPISSQLLLKHPDEDTLRARNLKVSGQNESGSYNPISVDFHGRWSSISRVAGGNAGSSERDGFLENLFIAGHHIVTVHVQELFELLPNDEPRTACREIEDDDDDEETCLARCRMNLIRDFCHCTPRTVLYLIEEDERADYPPCDYRNCTLHFDPETRLNINMSDAACTKGCLRSCTQIRYRVDYEKAGAVRDITGRFLRPETKVELHWGSFEYLQMEQKYEWSVATFIAALGGSIGMWLGLSILSLIQAFTYFYDYCSRRIIREKFLKQAAEEIPEDNQLSVNPLASPFKKRSEVMRSASVSSDLPDTTVVQIV